MQESMQNITKMVEDINKIRVEAMEAASRIHVQTADVSLKAAQKAEVQTKVKEMKATISKINAEAENVRAAGSKLTAESEFYKSPYGKAILWLDKTFHALPGIGLLMNTGGKR